MKKFILLQIFMFLIIMVKATSYYVDGFSTNGNDGYTGLAAVFNGTDGPWKTIQHAIDNVGSGDVIYVLNTTTYVENLTWPPVDGITLMGWDDFYQNTYQVIIDGGGNGAVITIASNSTSATITNNTIIEWFEITDGSATNGAGIYMDGYVAPVLDHLYIHDNTADYGGGIYYHPRYDYVYNGLCYKWTNYLSSCQITNSAVSYNGASMNGGGIYLTSEHQTTNGACVEAYMADPSLDLVSSGVRDNEADGYGGGIYAEYSYVTIDNSDIGENIADNDDGGGMYLYKCRTNFNTVLFDANNAVLGSGGAISLSAGLFIGTNCTQDCNPFTGIEHVWTAVEMNSNSAGLDGGGLYLSYPSGSQAAVEEVLDVIYEGGLIRNNKCDRNGGGIYIDKYSLIRLKDIELRNNTATENGGGIYNNCEWYAALSAGTNYPHYLEQILIDKNKATNSYGGGIFTKQTFYCINSTIADNEAGTDGGGIACVPYYTAAIPHDVTPVFHNTIIYDNFITGGSDNQIYLFGTTCDPQFAWCSIEGYTNQQNNGFSGLGGGVNWTPYAWVNCNPPIADIQPGWWGHYHCSNSPPINGGHSPLCVCPNIPGFGSYFGFVWNYDFVGNDRIYSTTVIDMGVYEEPVNKSMNGTLDQNSNSLTSLVLKVQPNPWPGDQELEINLNLSEKTKLILTLTDVIGVVVYRCERDMDNNGTASIKGNELSLKPGVYILTVDYHTSKNYYGKISRKIIKV